MLKAKNVQQKTKWPNNGKKIKQQRQNKTAS